MSAMRAFAFGLARVMGITGGLLLIALVILTCVSIGGRGLNTIGNLTWVRESIPSVSGFLQVFRPVTGDFELVEMGMALAIFLFLPWCQLNRGHAAVDLLTTRSLSVRANDFLLLLWEILLTGIIAVITWRVFAGMNDKMLYGETTFLLQWPVWWGYAVCVGAGVGAIIVGVISVILQLTAFFTIRANAVGRSGE